jgi:hypothetical protein
MPFNIYIQDIDVLYEIPPQQIPQCDHVYGKGLVLNGLRGDKTRPGGSVRMHPEISGAGNIRNCNQLASLAGTNQRFVVSRVWLNTQTPPSKPLKQE